MFVWFERNTTTFFSIYSSLPMPVSWELGKKELQWCRANDAEVIKFRISVVIEAESWITSPENSAWKMYFG